MTCKKMRLRVGPGRMITAGMAIILVLACVRASAQEVTPSIPLPNFDYRIGTRDLIQITVFEHAELNQTVRVAEDGAVTLVLLGRVEVAGLTAQELEQKLANLLAEKYILNPQVTVFVQEHQRVSILGAVGRPGQYEIVGPTNLLHVISQAGGMTADAASEIYVYRDLENGQKTRIPVNLRDLTLDGKLDLNISVQPKDVIYIPIDQTLTVYVYGEVRNPGALQYKASRKITLLQAIAQAGGPTEWASKSRITITRKDPNTGKEIKIPVNLKNIINNKRADIILEDGDVVIVP